MKKSIVISTLVILILPILPLFQDIVMASTLEDPPTNTDANNNNGTYKTLDEMLKELKEQRKIIEQQKIEAIKAKKLEEELLEQEKRQQPGYKEPKPAEESKPKTPPEETKANSEIPTLIVRLRGKHSSKYLCEYDFIIKNDTTEKKLNKVITTDYTKLLKKPSLKVRADEVINFEFSQEPKELNVYFLGENTEKMKVKRGCIRVPDVEGKFVVIIEGIYSNGYIKYAVILDVRK